MSMLFPPCSQVYLGCRDGVPMIPGGSSSSGREPMLVAQPMLQRSAVLGWGRGRSDGRASFVLVRVWQVARGSLAQKIPPFAWPCGRLMSRAAAMKHWIVLNYL